MKQLLTAAIFGLPMVACSAANEDPSNLDANEGSAPADTQSEERAAAAAHESEAKPYYKVTTKDGRTVSWFELAPGQTIVAEGVTDDQEFQLKPGMDIAAQFRTLEPNAELPEALVQLSDRVEYFKSASPEELAALAGDTAQIEDGNEAFIVGEPDPFYVDSEAGAPALNPLSSVGQPDTLTDAFYTRNKFWENTQCGGEFNWLGWDPLISRTRRTGPDDAQINAVDFGAYASIVTYRGMVNYIVKGRIDYRLFYGGWETLVDAWTVPGERLSWSFLPNSPKEIDIKAHVREANNDGWHNCIREGF